MAAMLEGLRVLDLTNERGLLCGQILADLGADVIQIEPPGGSSARRLGPWYKDERAAERSLHLLRMPTDAEHDVAKAGGRKLVQQVGHEGTAVDLGQHLRPLSDRRAQPRAEAAREDRDRNARELDGRAHALRKAP